MEQITKRDGLFYYGQKECQTADDAYRLFREDYHKSLGRNPYARLDHLGRRSERIHGFGYIRIKGFEPQAVYTKRVPYRIIGLVGISYSRIIGLWDMPPYDEDKLEQWLEWAFTRGSGALKRVGTDKTGRTSKRKKVRYR